MRILLLVLVLATFTLGCDKLPWTQTGKKGDPKTKVATKGQSKEIKTTQDIQTALTNAGYYKGPIDGKSSSALNRSIKQFQKDNGLAPDGEVGAKTKLKLKKFVR